MLHRVYDGMVYLSEVLFVAWLAVGFVLSAPLQEHEAEYEEKSTARADCDPDADLAHDGEVCISVSFGAVVHRMMGARIFHWYSE